MYNQINPDGLFGWFLVSRFSFLVVSRVNTCFSTRNKKQETRNRSHQFVRIYVIALKWIAIYAWIPLVLGCAPEQVPDDAVLPDILLIVADDLAYTDLGVYGGEIGTPNLDALAREGVAFKNFYTASTCSPTRSMVLSGVDNHLAGFGTMAGDHAGDQLGAPGYETFLNFRVATLAELLKDAGYATHMTGKWHLGGGDDVIPSARGFDNSFIMIEGGGGHFDTMGMFSADRPVTYKEDGQPAALPPDFYSTHFFTMKMRDYIEESVEQNTPFFGYLAYTAPHWPLQAPDSSIARHQGDYDEGHEVLFERRLAKMKELGLITEDTEPHPGLSTVKPWSALSEDEKRVESKRMEIYAAMVRDLDTYVGVLINYLKSIGRFENTLILFMSDNGAEGHDLAQAFPSLPEWIAQCCDNSYENMGRANSYLDYGPAWARAGVGPYRMYKAFANEGGIRAPAFVHYGSELGIKGWEESFVTAKDIMPTILDLAGMTHPAEQGSLYKGREVLPMQGKSMWPLLTGDATSVHGSEPVMGWELFGRRAIRKGDWKLTWTTAPYGPSRWELFNLREDPGEIYDLSDQYPEMKDELITLWDEYVAENGVVISEEPFAY